MKEASLEAFEKNPPGLTEVLEPFPKERNRASSPENRGEGPPIQGGEGFGPVNGHPFFHGALETGCQSPVAGEEVVPVADFPAGTADIGPEAVIDRVHHEEPFRGDAGAVEVVIGSRAPVQGRDEEVGPAVEKTAHREGVNVNEAASLND